MKRRTFLKGLTAFLAAPLAVFGAKKLSPKPDLYVFGERTIETEGYLTDSDQWFLKDPWELEGDMIYTLDDRLRFNAEKVKHRKLWKMSTH